MNDNQSPSIRMAAAVAFPVIIAIVSSLFALSYLITILLGLPAILNLPLAVSLAGVPLVLVGLAWMVWTFRNRNPAEVILSTYITLTKLFGKALVSDRAGRTEPLVVSGPQKYTRNPLYFGIVVMVFGWALYGEYTFVFVATIVLLIWFGLILIPFEERELHVLFGEQWGRYAQETPMLIPFTKRKKVD